MKHIPINEFIRYLLPLAILLAFSACGGGGGGGGGSSSSGSGEDIYFSGSTGSGSSSGSSSSVSSTDATQALLDAGVKSNDISGFPQIGSSSGNVPELALD